MDIMDILFLATCFVLTLVTLYDYRKWPHRAVLAAFVANAVLMVVVKPLETRIYAALLLLTVVVAEVQMARKKKNVTGL